MNYLSMSQFGQYYYYDEYGYARATKKLPQDVPYDTWAPQMWQHFNDLATNFKDTSSFSTQVHSLINQIPCPECKTDGLSYVKTNPPEIVRDKGQAQQWVSNYHKHVDQVAAKKPGWGFYAGGGGQNWATTSGGVSNWSDSHPDWQMQITTIPGEEGTDTQGGAGGGPGGGQGGGPGVGGRGGGTGADQWVRSHLQGFYRGEGGISKSCIGDICAISTGGSSGGGEGTATVTGMPQGSLGGFQPSQLGYSRDLKDPWYSTMWAQLHEYAYDFNPATFAEDVRNQIEQIPQENERCYINSHEFMRNNPPEYVRNRDQAMYWMCRFHNHASLDAGNGLVDCEIDAEGYGYVSGHDDYARDFFYGGGSRGGGSRGGGQQGGQRGGGRHKRGGHGGGMRGGGGQMGQMRGGGGMNQMGPGGYDQPQPPAVVPGQPGQPGSDGTPGQPGIGGSGGAGGSATGGQGGAGGAGGVGRSGYGKNEYRISIA